MSGIRRNKQPKQGELVITGDQRSFLREVGSTAVIICPIGHPRGENSLLDRYQFTDQYEWHSQYGLTGAWRQKGVK